MTKEEAFKIELTDERREVLKEIDKKVKEARALLDECQKLADEHHVSFSFYGIGNMNNHYIPPGGGVDEYGEESDPEYGYDGWQSSSC